jgi:hypothetical protein
VNGEASIDALPTIVLIGGQLTLTARDQHNQRKDQIPSYQSNKHHDRIWDCVAVTPSLNFVNAATDVSLIGAPCVDAQCQDAFFEHHATTYYSLMQAQLQVI